MDKLKKHINFYTLFPLICMMVLAFINLNNRFMWPDESITALLGKNILEFGIPRVWDGNHVVSFLNGNDFTDQFIHVNQTWLQFYIAAFGQLFGSSNFAVRFWFVVTGLLSAVAFYFHTYSLTRDMRTAKIALWIYAFSVQVLLYIRQARYYAPTLLLIMVTHLAFNQSILHNKKRYWTLFILFSILLFHTNYMVFAITLGVIGLTYLLYDWKKETYRRFFISCGVILLFVIPWFIWMASQNAANGNGYKMIFNVFWLQFWAYVWQIQAYLFPFITLLILGGLVGVINKCRGVKREKSLDGLALGQDFNQLLEQNEKTFTVIGTEKNLTLNRSIWILAMTIIVNIFLISLVFFDYSTRFLLACLPACFMLSAIMLNYLLKKDRLLGTIVLVLFLFTNVLHIAPYWFLKNSPLDAETVDSVVKPPVAFYKLPWVIDTSNLEEYLSTPLFDVYLKDYILGSLSDYDDSTEGMVRFAKRYIKPDDTVFLYGDNVSAITYYTGIRLVNNLVDPDEPTIAGYRLPWQGQFKNYPNAKKYSHLTAYPFQNIDWIIMQITREEEGFYWQNREKYKCITLNYPHMPFIADLWQYNFYTNYSYPKLRIYRNKLTTEPIGKVQLKQNK